MYKINVLTSEWVEYDMPYFALEGNGDIHCNYSPDKQYIIGDGYPKNGYRMLLGYNLKTGNSKIICSALTDIPDIIDIRCDLHARFVFGGKFISFDTTHNGKREIALIPSEILNNIG